MRKIKENELPVLLLLGDRHYNYMCNDDSLTCGKLMIGDSGYCLQHLNLELKKLGISEIKRDARGDLWWSSSIDAVSNKLLGIDYESQKVNSLPPQPITFTRWQRIGLFLLQKLFGLPIALLEEHIKVAEESRLRPKSLAESGLFD